MFLYENFKIKLKKKNLSKYSRTICAKNRTKLEFCHRSPIVITALKKIQVFPYKSKIEPHYSTREILINYKYFCESLLKYNRISNT